MNNFESVNQIYTQNPEALEELLSMTGEIVTRLPNPIGVMGPLFPIILANLEGKREFKVFESDKNFNSVLEWAELKPEPSVFDPMAQPGTGVETISDQAKSFLFAGHLSAKSPSMDFRLKRSWLQRVITGFKGKDLLFIHSVIKTHLPLRSHAAIRFGSKILTKDLAITYFAKTAEEENIQLFDTDFLSEKGTYSYVPVKCEGTPNFVLEVAHIKL